jgi:hypothetical protein
LSVLEKVRRWIDGETAELVLEEAARNAQVKPRSKAEEFIVKIARAVEGSYAERDGAAAAGDDNHSDRVCDLSERRR